MKKSAKIVICLFAVILICGCFAVLSLGSKGMLGFYHPLNKAKDGQIKIACVGDSLTHGYTVKGWKKNNYPVKLSGMLGDGYCVNNYGNTGHTVSKEGNKPYTSKKLYRESLDFQPDIVIIMLGSNDSKPGNWKDKEYFKKEYKEIITSYIELESKPKVYIGIPTQVFEVDGKISYNLDKNLIEGDICESAVELADELGLPVIDINTAMKDRRDLFGKDGAHPNADGAMVMAETVYKALNQ